MMSQISIVEDRVSSRQRGRHDHHSSNAVEAVLLIHKGLDARR
jgi:hypothetical protein